MALEPKNPDAYEAFGKEKVGFGKYSELEVRFLAAIDPDYAAWLVRTMPNSMSFHARRVARSCEIDLSRRYEAAAAATAAAVVAAKKAAEDREVAIVQAIVENYDAAVAEKAANPHAFLLGPDRPPGGHASVFAPSGRRMVPCSCGGSNSNCRHCFGRGEKSK